MQSCSEIKKKDTLVWKKLNMRKLLIKQRGICCSAALKTQEKGKKNKKINVCQGKSTTVLARKRNICKLLR